MTIRVNDLRGLLLTAIIRVVFLVLYNFSVHPRLWVSLFVFLVSALAYKTSSPDVRPQVDSPPLFFNAARSSLVTRLPDVVAKLPIFQHELAIQAVKSKAATTERDTAIARTHTIANEKQVLLARILELEAENDTLSNKLQMDEMTIAWLEEQITIKTEPQNEILEDMGKLEGELEAVKGELDAAKTTIIELETRLRDSSMNVVSLEHQIALKTEAQNEILEGMDYLEDELKTAKVKIQETAAQKAAIERDLVEFREFANRVPQTMTSGSEASDQKIISQKVANIAVASQQTPGLYPSEPRRPAVDPPILRQSQLNTPPTSPQKSLLFGRARASVTRKVNASPSPTLSMHKFGLSSIRGRIPSRQGRVGSDFPKKSASVSSASPVGSTARDQRY